ncbi:pilus assembly protein TadG-related protein [Planctellipticum variicoloris]|uniref:pilus assembly protein TadG-related protein n=1 Tax=Planctellipticum variicoloris TaxID=3064265 RepID=UPI003013F7FB|nr:pilus assembly protein TadG-related protein [Planctomycetaceae bacterium SH412]
MRRMIPGSPRNASRARSRRSGNIVVLTALLITFLFALVAFAVDLGYVSRTKTQLQSAVDGSALAAAIELGDGLGFGPKLTPSTAAAFGRTAATYVADKNPNGDQNSTTIQTATDMQFGQYDWNAASGTWEKRWDATPYNLVKVTVRRDGAGSKGSGPLPLLFAPVIGYKYSNLNETAYAALRVGVGIQLKPGSGLTADVLPIALDLGSWNNLMAGIGSDIYAFNTTTKAISSGSDGVKEIDLYPYGVNSLPPGNRGTVDLGDPNNSTADLKRQILHGLNETDLSYFGGKLTTDNGPLYINGDTGISAGIKADLEAIKGQPRLIPLFTAVSGPGNNATYTIVKFVPIRILYVQLTGSNKRVIVQPCPFVSHAVIPGNAPIAVDSYFTPPRLVK